MGHNSGRSDNIFYSKPQNNYFFQPVVRVVSTTNVCNKLLHIICDTEDHILHLNSILWGICGVGTWLSHMHGIKF